MEYLTTAQAARYSGISVSTLNKLRAAGTGCEYVRLGDSKTKAVVRYKRAAFDEWLRKNTVKTAGGV